MPSFYRPGTASLMRRHYENQLMLLSFKMLAHHTRTKHRNGRKRQRIRVSGVSTFPQDMFHGMSASSASSVSAAAMLPITYCR